MEEICRGKTVFLLTATPINNSLFDLVHEAEMFTEWPMTTSRVWGLFDQRLYAKTRKTVQRHRKGSKY